MKDKRRLSLYGWTTDHDKAIEIVYQQLVKQGIRLEHDGKPNTSAILLYLLEKEARKSK